MSVPYAEVIGDPVAHSLSPLIHDHWLKACNIPGRFDAVRVSAAELDSYFLARNVDPDWRGCSVTLPHKENVAHYLDRVDSAALRIGAVNCVHRIGAERVGANTDVEGIAAALAGAELSGRKAVMIGAGGAARAAVEHLARSGARELVLLVRDPEKGAALAAAAPDIAHVRCLKDADIALAGADVIINASPLGMRGAQPMPPDLLDAVERHAAGTTVFDMVYQPVETALLKLARANGGAAVDGLRMLVGQARGAFRLFFGQPAPAGDQDLISLLERNSSVRDASNAVDALA